MRNTGRVGVVLVIALIALAAGYEYVSDVLEKRKAATPVNFDTISSSQVGDKVAIEGWVAFFKTVSCNSSSICTLYLEPTPGVASPSRRVVLWISETSPGRPEPNSFYLPALYEQKADLRLYTADGRQLGIEDRVRITGTVEKITEEEGLTTVCILVEKVE